MIGWRALCASLLFAPVGAFAQTGDSRFAAWFNGVRAEGP
jgi:hypothetical protein